MMQISDLVNGSFELLASGFVLNHCRVLLRDKAVAGVSIASTVFFLLWGFWNLFYYPHLGQILSFYGGIAITVANICYVFLLFKYRRNNPSRETYSGGDGDLILADLRIASSYPEIQGRVESSQDFD